MTLYILILISLMICKGEVQLILLRIIILILSTLVIHILMKLFFYI
jgi:hypothetical protein